MTSRWSALLVGGAAFAFSASAGFAADLSMKDAPELTSGNKLEFTGYVQGTNDYVFRGISANRRNPVAQGGIDATYGMFYAGTFISGVDFTDAAAPGAYNDTHIEVDLYAGIRPKFGDVTFDFGAIWYTYPYTNFNNFAGTYDPEYVEVKAGASITAFKDLALSATAYYSPDYAFQLGDSWTVEGTASKPVYTYGGVAFAVSGTVGTVQFNKDEAFGVPLNSYVYYNAGITATYKEKYSLDLRYWDTDLDAGQSPGGALNSVGGVNQSQAGSAFVATAKIAVP